MNVPNFLSKASFAFFFFFGTNTHGFVNFTEVSGVNEWRAKLDNSNRLISIGPALGWIRREQTVGERWRRFRLR